MGKEIVQDGTFEIPGLADLAGIGAPGTSPTTDMNRASEVHATSTTKPFLDSRACLSVDGYHGL
jgi:hypothetical protein